MCVRALYVCHVCVCAPYMCVMCVCVRALYVCVCAPFICVSCVCVCASCVCVCARFICVCVCAMCVQSHPRQYFLCCSRVSPEKNVALFARVVGAMAKHLRAWGITPFLCGAAADLDYARDIKCVCVCVECVCAWLCVWLCVCILCACVY